MNNATIKVCSNLSSNVDIEEVWQLDHGKVIPAFAFLYIVVGLPWNILVVIIAVKKRLYHQPTIMLLLNLVVTDILMLLIQLPMIIANGIVGEYIFGSTSEIRCRTCFTGFIPVALMMDSLFVIAMMSVDRFLFIYKPLLYERKASTRGILLAIALTATLSIAIGLFPFIDEDTFYFNEDFLSCTIEVRLWYTKLLITIACIALTVIIVCNIWVIYIVQKNIREVYNIRKALTVMDKNSHIQDLSERVRKERHKKELHLFRVFGGLLLSNLIAWVPTIILYMLFMLSVDVSVAFITFAQILFLGQVTVHPILETALISDLRKPLKEMITCGFLKRKKNILDTSEERTFCYSCCCKSSKEHSGNHGNCSIIWTSISAALLPRDSSGNIGPHTCAVNLSREQTHDEIHSAL